MGNVSKKTQEEPEFTRKHSLAKRIFYDIAGFGLVVLGIILSPVPGPGGIPLIIIGLALLAQNYSWARKATNRLKRYLADSVKKSFPENDVTTARTYDVMAPLLLVLGIWLISKGGRIFLTLGIFVVFQALFLFFGNRKRGQRLWSFFKKIIFFNKA